LLVGGWSNAAFVSCSFITPTGIITATGTELASRSMSRCQETDQTGRRLALVKDLSSAALLMNAGNLGRRVWPYSNKASRVIHRAVTITRSLH